MARFSLRRFDTQARIGIIASLASVVPFLGLIFVMFRRFDFESKMIFYGPPTKIAVYLGVLATLGLSSVGFGMGLNSAGQRRNDKQTWSWVGFFVGAAIICLTLLLFCFFRLRGDTNPV